MVKKAVLAVIAVVLLAGAYYWGYLCGRQEVAAQAYDQLLVDLSNSVLLRDALEAGKQQQVGPLVTSKLETDFARMIQLRSDHSFATSEHVRCAVSRRIRALKQSGQLLSDEKSLNEAGYPIDRVNSYLSKECLGEPSHTNWAEPNKSQEGKGTSKQK